MNLQEFYGIIIDKQCVPKNFYNHAIGESLYIYLLVLGVNDHTFQILFCHNLKN